MTENSRSMVFSYLALRRLLGFFGIYSPMSMACVTRLTPHCHQLQSSLGAYYFTWGIVLFTGNLFAMGFFLLTYRGYDKMDNLITNLAGVCALGIALFPTSMDAIERKNCNTSLSDGGAWVALLHLVFAFLFSWALWPGLSLQKRQSSRGELCFWARKRKREIFGTGSVH